MNNALSLVMPSNKKSNQMNKISELEGKQEEMGNKWTITRELSNQS
jgi:hypothetical protein